MESKNLNNLWGISLFVIGIATFLLAGSTIIGKELSDGVTRFLGIIEMIALPVLIYTSIKKAGCLR